MPDEPLFDLSAELIANNEPWTYWVKAATAIAVGVAVGLRIGGAR